VNFRLALAASLSFAWASAAGQLPYKSVTLQALNKVTARVSEIEVKPLLPTSFGALDIEVKNCWRSANDERPEQAILIEIRERRSAFGQSDLVFSGWMFASSPALSAMEHPVYDISLIGCDL